MLPRSRGLPQMAGGSASALSLSRPAQASLTLRPTGLLNRLKRPLSGGSSPTGYPTEPLVSYQINRQLSGWNLPPLVIRAFGAHGHSRRFRDAPKESGSPPIADMQRLLRHVRKVPEGDIPTFRPQPRLRAPEFWQQPRRCHVCLQSQMRRSRLQLPVFPRLWPRFRCEEGFPDNRQWQDDAARMSVVTPIADKRGCGWIVR